MQILTINKRNFEKPSRKSTNRTQVNILKKNILDISPRENVRTSKFLAKSEGKAKFFSKIYQGHIRI
jgi:hypothetical protein